MLSELFSKWSGESADSLALIDANRMLTYGDLNIALNAISQSFSQQGLGAGDTVAAQFPNSIECAVSLLAAARLDTRILLLDPALKSGELEKYCVLAGARKLLRPASAQAGASELLCCGGAFGEICIRVSTLHSASRQAESHCAFEEGGAFLLLSSGTSGPPKLLLRTAAQTGAAIESFRATLPYGPEDNVLALLPFFHSFGLLNVLLSTLASGATLHVASFSPRQTVAMIADRAITVLPATPFMFRILVDTQFSKAPNVSSLRLAISAGAALPQELGERFSKKFGLGIHQSYGSTETGPASLARPEERIAEPGWVGRPYANVTFLILDDDGREAAPGVTGDIVVKSVANASEYLGNEEASRSTFRDGCVHTGDVGHLNADGHVFVSGRKKSMLNIAGKKVSPDEVEHCLISHPRVADAHVTSVASDASERITAYVVSAGDVTAIELQEFCGERLADFKVPRQIQFVASLSRGVMGKVPNRLNPEPEA